MTDFIITFRETLEASLIVGIVLAYLSQTNRKVYNHIIYLAVFLAIIGSVITAIIFNVLFGGFTGVAEEIFEGVAMIIASVMVSTIILWMMKQGNKVKELQNQVDHHLSIGQEIGLFTLVFLSVLREGVETVIFLAASSLNGSSNLYLALLGVICAITIGFYIFKLGVSISLKPFFTFTSIFLILFGAGLFAHGIHELQEAKIIPIIVEHVWDINFILNEKGQIGEILKHLFGYNGNPSLIEVVSYILYLNAIYWCYLLTNKDKKVSSGEQSSLNEKRTPRGKRKGEKNAKR
jgi:high-affinity iron transporter